jgi:exodeoxyribonuclease V alpha subunit
LDPGVFAGNEKKSLDCDLLVIDESSMADVPLMSDLLQAIPRTQISFWSVM